MTGATVHRLRSLAWLLFLTLSVAWVGSGVTRPEIAGWYHGLAKPAFTPPDRLFGPVWTALYILMAFAAWMAQMASRDPQRPLLLFGFQLTLNLLWSFLFFGFHRIGLALAEILLLWLAILVTCVEFWRIRRLAGLLFLPYLAWAGYAATLNFAIWRLN